MQPFEGKVGAVYEDLGIFVTSPNTTVIADPVYGKRNIRMRKDYHFGEEDPMYFPQPYNESVAHLAVIPLPSLEPDHPHAVAWVQPRPEHFQHISMNQNSDICAGLGVISSDLRTMMERSTARVFERCTEFLPPFHKDPFISEYVAALRFMQAQLKCAMDRERAFRTWAICQRVYLELVARLDWIKVYQFGAVVARKLARVVGALVDDLDTAVKLGLLNIPFWYTRPTNEMNDYIRVDKWIPPQAAAETLKIRTHGFALCMDDTSPMQPPVYAGPVRTTDLTRYQSMSAFIRERVVIHLYDTQYEGYHGQELSKIPESSTPVRSSKSQKKRFNPLAAKSGTPKPPPGNRNKFDEVRSNIVPLGYTKWIEASSEVGKDFNPNVHRDSEGYILPDPSLIAAAGLESQNFAIRNSYMDSWLKLRTLLLYRITTNENKPLKTSQWRMIIGLRALGFKHQKAQKQKVEVEAILETILRDGSLKNTVDLTKLDDIPSLWRGEVIIVDDASPETMAEVLWELFEINFRYDLLMCDHHWHRGEAHRDDRETEVLSFIRHSDGHLLPNMDPHSRPKTYPANNLYERQLAIVGILAIMNSWKGRGQLPSTLATGSGIQQRLQEATKEPVTAFELDEIEFSVARHYIEVFAGTFGRAPVLPRQFVQ
ncbi:hypothetical protein VNI00_014915 [Paramarasmius palmivorus]|uniref:Uncharacterized protein n=1 Tax=Paramarasmius palmivorus TaxID=297713 RepID=A0AAW0BNQ6_9AGAR